MNTKTQRQSSHAFTALELAVVIGIVALFAFFLSSMVPNRRASSKAVRIQCVNNQKQIGTAYRIWAGDHTDKYPADISPTSTDAGWHDFVALTNAGQYCWMNYAIMSNEFGLSTKTLVCPSDVRNPAFDFTNIRNANISYFWSPSANDNLPSSILAGDRNLAPGTIPKNDFGYSPKDGTGNDIILQTNSPVCWSLKMHSTGYAEGSGDILLGDGSVQMCSSARLRSEYISNAATPSNFPTAFDNSKSNSFRLIFP